MGMVTQTNEQVNPESRWEHDAITVRETTKEAPKTDPAMFPLDHRQVQSEGFVYRGSVYMSPDGSKYIAVITSVEVRRGGALSKRRINFKAARRALLRSV